MSRTRGLIVALMTLFKSYKSGLKEPLDFPFTTPCTMCIADHGLVWIYTIVGGRGRHRSCSTKMAWNFTRLLIGEMDADGWEKCSNRLLTCSIFLPPLPLFLHFLLVHHPLWWKRSQCPWLFFSYAIGCRQNMAFCRRHTFPAQLSGLPNLIDDMSDLPWCALTTANIYENKVVTAIDKTVGRFFLKEKISPSNNLFMIGSCDFPSPKP